jgi:hypothetical protein
MKDKIEFVSKVIGLVIVCSAIVSAIGLAYLIIFLGTDYSQLQQINSNNSFGSRELNNVLYAMFKMERQFYVKLLILSLLPIPFGMYLMKSNNIFVIYCCPEEAGESNAELFEPASEEISGEDDFNIGDDSNEDGIGYGRCPECNADLIRRQVEHGQHVGKYYISCSNFPRCKQIKPYKARQTETEQPFRL